VGLIPDVLELLEGFLILLFLLRPEFRSNLLLSKSFVQEIAKRIPNILVLLSVNEIVFQLLVSSFPSPLNALSWNGGIVPFLSS
jgi:hypothetical protein